MRAFAERLTSAMRFIVDRWKHHEEEIHVKTFMANAQNVERNWYVVDADGMTLGRLASQLLRFCAARTSPPSPRMLTAVIM